MYLENDTMTVYHINDEDQVLPCTATKKECEFKKESPDGQSNHYETLSEAYERLADRFDEQDALAGMRKDNRIFEIEDVWGDTIELQAGVLNEDSENIFRNGQCLALASELAKKLGSDQIAVVTVKQELDEEILDNNGNVALDENGDPVVGTRDVIYHAYAVSKGGQDFYDVDGPIPAARVKGGYSEKDGYKVKYSWVVESAGYEDDMGEQDYEFAATVVDQVLTKPMEAYDPKT